MCTVASSIVLNVLKIVVGNCFVVIGVNGIIKRKTRRRKNKGEDCYICSKECKEEYYKQNLDGEEDNY